MEISTAVSTSHFTTSKSLFALKKTSPGLLVGPIGHSSGMDDTYEGGMKHKSR